MFEKIFALPDKFWQRLFIVFLAYEGAQIAINTISIPFIADESFLVAVFAIFSFIGLYLIPKILINPFLSYIIIQLMFFWMVLEQFLKKTVHISVKTHAVIFGFAILAGIIYFFKNFNFLWKFIMFRFLFIFFLINIIYYLCYYSDFNLNLVSLTSANMSSENQSARTIIFLDSLAILVSSIISLSLFVNINSKTELDRIICKISKILCYCFVLFVLLFPLVNENYVSGAQIFLPIYFFLILGFKYYVDNIENNNLITPRFSNLMAITTIILFGITIIRSNKSSLVAILASTFLFVLINYRLKLKFYVSKLLENKKLGIIFAILFIGLFLFIAAKFNILKLIQQKLEAILNSVTGGGITSYYIRKSNWNLFINYWTSHLDTFNCLFGFGIGKSREIIYYLTRAQYSPIYLVQTTHSHYMEMFFDYGVVALFYFISLILIFYQNTLNLINKKIHNNIKLISNISNCLIIFYFIYHYADGLRVPTAIIFFSALMLFEGIKYKLQNFYKNKEQNILSDRRSFYLK